MIKSKLMEVIMMEQTPSTFQVCLPKALLDVCCSVAEDQIGKLQKLHAITTRGEDLKITVRRGEKKDGILLLFRGATGSIINVLNNQWSCSIESVNFLPQPDLSNTDVAQNLSAAKRQPKTSAHSAETETVGETMTDACEKPAATEILEHQMSELQPSEKNQPQKKRRVLPTYRNKYGPEQISRAYEMWKNEGVSVYKAAKTCGIPVGTLRDRTTRGHCNPYKYKSGPSPLLSSTEEAALVAHVKDIAVCGYGYTRRELAELAGETAFFLNKRDTSAPLHDKWVYEFLKRWPELKMIKPKGLCMVGARSATRETLDNYYKELLIILQKYKLLEKPHRIFSVDETGVSTEHIPPKIVAQRGRTPLAVVSNRSATAMIISTVSAIGQVLPPYIIFKGKRMCDDLLAGALPGTQAAMSETGWSNTKVFQMYLIEHLLKYVPTNKDEPLLLLYDGHSSHINVPLIEWARKHNIILFQLPAHTSHLLQPLDVGVFGPFEVSYYNECSNYLRKHPGQIITQYDVCRLTANALSHTMTLGNIIGSFKRTGIYPFNASVVTDEQLAPSTSVNPPKQHSHIDQHEQKQM